jgi:hypothetical protein
MTDRDVGLLCGIGQHDGCPGVIRPLFGLAERPCRCDCHQAEQSRDFREIT